MAASVASLANTTYATRTNTTVTAPSGITNGDLLIGVMMTGAVTTAPTVTPPAGFNQISISPLTVSDDGGFQARFAVWTKVASGEAGNYTFTHTNCASQGVVLRVSGADTGTAPIASGHSRAGADPRDTTTADSITTVTNDTLVILLAHDWADTTNNLTAPAGTTPTFGENLDVTLTTIFSGVLASAGATGNKSFTNNNSGAGSEWQAYLLGIAPAGGGGAKKRMLAGLLAQRALRE